MTVSVMIYLYRSYPVRKIVKRRNGWPRRLGQVVIKASRRGVRK